MLEVLSRQKRIVVCVGPGGVGKTTTAAALGALSARQGRRTLVCTIDPAPRLADALGVGTLGPDPQPIPPEASRALGIDRDGLLSAVRLDTQRAFAGLVEEQVSEPEMRGRIFSNPIYRQITTALSGSQEYAATLALYDLARRRQYDLIVLDTPPTQNALDFLAAPQRIAEAVSSPAIQWFARPDANGGKAGGFSFQRLRSGSAIVIRRLAKFVGSQFLDDIGAFLVDFRDVLGGFLERARQIEALLRSADVGFVLVLAPEVPAVNEALYFHARLREAGIPLGAFVANRVHQLPGDDDAAAIARRLRAQPAVAALGEGALLAAAQTLAASAHDLRLLCASERRELDRLTRDAPGVPLTEVPLFEHEIDSLAELRRVGDYLAGGGHVPPQSFLQSEVRSPLPSAGEG
jgi:anion-transporting  ArsA/GET3 family ATPase